MTSRADDPPSQRFATSAQPFIIAHRGASIAAPENTILAFQTAYEAGADGIELDVLPTADGHLIVMHDGSVGRTTDGRGRVGALGLNEIRALRAVHNGGLTNEPVPALTDVLAWLPGGFACLVELKARGSAELLLAELRRTRTRGRIGVCSFLASELRVMRQEAPEIPLILNLPWYRFFQLERLTTRAAELGAAGVFLFPKCVTPELVSHAHQLGLEVHAGPANSTSTVRKMLEAGVDAIESDDPVVAVEALKTAV